MTVMSQKRAAKYELVLGKCHQDPCVQILVVHCCASCIKRATCKIVQSNSESTSQFFVSKHACKTFFKLHLYLYLIPSS